MAKRSQLTIATLLLATGGDVGAQPELTAVSQVSPPAERTSTPDASAAQVDGNGQRGLLSSPKADREVERRPLQQLVDGTPSAEATPALSSTVQSRPEPRTILNGEDRCDPATRNRLPSASCARVVESRSSEFDRTPPPLSPEQRLLLEQRAFGSNNQQGVARRLATGEATQEDQAVASIATRRPPAPADGKEEENSPLSKEQAAAIVGAILNPPRN
jgi:hypothetical protein